MARLRFMAVALLALALAGNSVQPGRSAGQKDSGDARDPYYDVPYSRGTTKSAADDRSCEIYSLTKLGHDADLGRWIAQTIPEMIESKSWQQSGGSGVLRYYAPKNILIVNNSADVLKKVNGFLKNLKTSLPKTKHASVATSKKSTHSNVVPADYRAPALMGTSSPLPEPSGYPVPTPVKAPKHLFHFLIRYEGEGIIDDNVVKFMKVQNLVGNGSKPATASASGNCCPVGTTMPYSGGKAEGVPSQGYSPADPLVSSTPPNTLAPSSPAGSPTTVTNSPAVLATSPPVVASPVAEPKKKGDKKEEK